MKKINRIHILNIFIFLMIVIPKSWGNILGIIPLRLILSCLFVGYNLIDIIKNKRFNVFGKKYIVLYVLFLLFTIPSFFVTKSLITSSYTFIKFFIAFLIFIIMLNMDLKKEELKSIGKSFILALSIVLIYGLIQYLFDVNLFKIGASKYPGAKGRIQSTFFNTIYYSIFLNMVITLLTYFIRKEKDIKIKIFYAVLLVLSFVSLLLTFTRSAIMIFVGCLIINILLNSKTIFNRWCLPIYIFMISFSLLIPGVKTLYISTYDDITLLVSDNLVGKFLPNIDKTNKHEIENDTSEIVHYTEDASLNSRIEFSKIGNRLAKDHIKTGIGFGAYNNYVYSNEYIENYPQYANYKTFPHSSLVLLYAEVSIGALISFCLFAISIIIDFCINWFKNYKNNKNLKELSGLALTIIAGFIVVNIVAENAIYDSQIFPIFLIIIGLLGNKSLKKEGEVCQK